MEFPMAMLPSMNTKSMWREANRKAPDRIQGLPHKDLRGAVQLPLCNVALQIGLLAAPMFELLPLYTLTNRQTMDCRIMSQGLLRLDPYLPLVYPSTYSGFPELRATPLLWIRVLLAVA